MDWSSKNQIVLASGVSFAVIIALLVLPVFASKDTMFFVNSSSSNSGCMNNTYFVPYNLTWDWTAINDNTINDTVGEYTNSSGLVGETISGIHVALSYVDNPVATVNNDTLVIGVFNGTNYSTIYQFGTINANQLIRYNSTVSSHPTGANYYNFTGSFVVGNNEIIGVKTIPSGIGNIPTDAVIVGFSNPDDNLNPSGIAENFNGFIEPPTTFDYSMKLDLSCDVDNVYNIANTVSSNFQIFKNSTTIGNTTTSYLRTIINGTGISMTNTSNTITAQTRFANGTGISITGSGVQTFTNTGVISNSCSTGVICSGTNPSSFTLSYQLLCQTTLNSGNASIMCNNFTAKNHLYITVEDKGDGTGTNPTIGFRFNGDTGNNYGERQSINGAADGTATSTSSCRPLSATTYNQAHVRNIELWVDSLSASDNKGGYGHMVYDINSAQPNTPSKAEFSCWWSNTSAQISSVSWNVITGTNKIASGSILTVWGYN